MLHGFDVPIKREGDIYTEFCPQISEFMNGRDFDKNQMKDEIRHLVRNQAEVGIQRHGLKRKIIRMLFGEQGF